MSAAWVDASRSPVVPGTNAHASAMTPLLFLIVHFSLITLGILMAVVFSVAYLSIKGLSVLWLLRKGKSRLRGQRISARPLFYWRRAIRVRSHGDCDMSVFRKVE